MLIEVLRKRRSIRKFQDRPVEPEKLEILIEAMLRSPSGRGIYPWEFIVVDDRQTLKKLSRARPHGSSFLAGAAQAVVICVDPAKTDVWIEDAAIAALILHLCSADLGLGSCWIQIRNRQHEDQSTAEAYVIEALGLKPGLAVEAMVAIGYADEEKPGRSADSLLRDRVSYNRYGTRR